MKTSTLLLATVGIVLAAVWLNSVLHARTMRKRLDDCFKRAGEIVAGVKSQYPGCEGALCMATTLATPNTTALSGLNATNCDPRLISVDDAGGTLTRASISGWNKADIESQYFKEVGLDKIIAHTKEARMAGAKQRTLQDLLLSRNAPLKLGGNGGKNPSIIQPFRFVPRENRVNPGYFRIYGGSATGVANAAHWRLTVTNGSTDADSSFLSKSPNNVLKNIEKYFMPGHYVTAEYNTAGGVARTAVMRVISSTNIDANSCYVFVAPNRTYANDATYGGNNAGSGPDWFGGASAGEKAVYQPTTGILKLQVNSVSNHESYGNALPGHNPFGLIEYWQQTHRWVHKYNDEYVKMLEAATTSDGLKKFRLLPLAKLRAQQQAAIEMAEFETFFYGDVISEQQTTTTWDKLPVVYDPAWAASGEAGTLAIEYKSNTLGLRTQIAACGLVFDKQGGRLDVDDLLLAGYYVKREREAEGTGSVSDIDIMTDQMFTRKAIRQLMTKYYKAQYGLDSVQAHCQMGQKITFNGSVMFEYDSYDIPDYGYRLNVFSDLYFDDRIAQFQTDQKSRGRAIWMIDWTDIAVNIIKTMSVTRTNNLADDLYKYVMAQNVQHVLMNSKTFEVAVGNTNRHRIIENYSDEAPKLTVPGFDLNG